MAILNRDEFFDRIQSIIGTNTDDEHMQFIEDMTDTYNSFTENSNSEDWEQRYNELDEAWRKKYMHRFFSSPPSTVDGEEKEKEVEITAENIDYDDIFKEEK